ncbi:MAG: hypothetical protein ACK5SQ_06640 [Chitinophagales bacterium]
MIFTPLISQPPALVLEKNIEEILEILQNRYPVELEKAIYPAHTIPSPLQYSTDTSWLKRANCVGINVRTIGSFWKIIPYSLTLPAAQNAIHILPIWEPGVVASLYGMSSWNVNPAFFSKELYQAFPHLDTVEKQLKVVINLLHLTGRVVGMDVVPHTDRYSEQVLANPSFFEWLQRSEYQIVNHDSHLYKKVELLLFDWLLSENATLPYKDADAFFRSTNESERLLLLFGEASDYERRLQRRKKLVQLLYDHGLETVPATMGPPYRGLEVDSDPSACVLDEEGRLWRDYRITQPQAMSRVFGPLTRYRLYEAVDQNKNWEIDFEHPVVPVWEYVCQHYGKVQEEYGFDFMRGDMSHVQMRPEGVPAQPDAYYDLLGAVKQYCRKKKPWFGYFAESFLAPPGEMAYGDEVEHLEASLADSTLGDLQSEPVGTPLFIAELARYLDLLHHRQFAPNFTIMTADKDDPRFDHFYLRGNEIRYFIGLFLPEMPSYMALGFETREPHPSPAPNEQYTKLYVFQLEQGPKATKGPYQWGKNMDLYQRLVRQKEMSNQLNDAIQASETRWLLPPDPSGNQPIIAWEAGSYRFIANLNVEQAQSVPKSLSQSCALVFSTHRRVEEEEIKLLPGEGWILRCQ